MAINQFPEKPVDKTDIKVTSTAPSNPEVGDIWIDNSQEVLNTDLVTSKISGPNLLHNGAMQVHQRADSVAGRTVGGYYTADRWNSSLNAQGTWTQSIEVDGPTGSGLTKSLKMLCTTANASPANSAFAGIVQQIEGLNLQAIAKGTLSAQPLILSFWVKSNVTGNYVIEPYDLSNTRHCSLRYTIDVPNIWEKKIVVIPADMIGTLANTSAAAMQIQFWLGAGSDYTSGILQSSWVSPISANRIAGQVNVAAANSNYWQITGVQLEIGMKVSQFQFKPYDQELRECQRYCYVWQGTDAIVGIYTYYADVNQITYAFVQVDVSSMRVRTSATGLTITGIGTQGTDFGVRSGGIKQTGFTFSLDSSSGALLANKNAHGLTATNTIVQGKMVLSADL